MKVLDLQCGSEHVFEGWFASEDDFVSQLGRGLVACPMCGDTHITKKLSAPRLNLGAARAPEPPPENAPRQQLVATTDADAGANVDVDVDVAIHINVNIDVNINAKCVGCASPSLPSAAPKRAPPWGPRLLPSSAPRMARLC